jgi:DNA transformation protein
MQEYQTMNVLTDLPNIGNALAETLASAGITSYEDLAALGSVDVALKIRAGLDPGACYNMLYALEGAIRGVRWHTIPKQERDKLRREFDYAAGH